MRSRAVGCLRSLLVTALTIAAVCGGCGLFFDQVVLGEFSVRTVDELRASPDGDWLVRTIRIGHWAGDADTYDVDLEFRRGEVVPLVRSAPHLPKFVWRSPVDLRIEGGNRDTVLTDARAPGLRLVFADLGPDVYYHGPIWATE